jgi:hypothetical protein
MQRNGYLDRTERAPLLETREELAPARGVWNGILLSSVLWLVAIAAFLVWNEQHDDKRCEAIKQTISSEYDLLISTKQRISDSVTDRWKALTVGCAN